MSRGGPADVLFHAAVQSQRDNPVSGQCPIMSGVTVVGAPDHANGTEPSRDTSSAGQTKAVNGGVTAERERHLIDWTDTCPDGVYR